MLIRRAGRLVIKGAICIQQDAVRRELGAFPRQMPICRSVSSFSETWLLTHSSLHHVRTVCVWSLLRPRRLLLFWFWLGGCAARHTLLLVPSIVQDEHLLVCAYRPHTVSAVSTREYEGKRVVFHTANFLTAKLDSISTHACTGGSCSRFQSPKRLLRIYATSGTEKEMDLLQCAEHKDDNEDVGDGVRNGLV